MLEENSQEFIEQSTIGIHAVSAEGIIKYANQFELDMLGYSEDEYVGHHVSEFQMDEVCLADMMERLNTSKQFLNYPARVRGKSEVKYILYNSSVFEMDGQFIHTRCFGSEIPKEVFDIMTKNRSA